MTADEKFLKVARDRFELARMARQKQLEREIEDLRFYAGEQWDDDLLRTRDGQTIGSGTTQQIVPARPSLTINKTREPVRQVLNQERQSDLGIELIPADDWGDETGPIDHSEIELREGLVRRIQRDSEAADARTWAFARATISGTGYWLVMTRYVKGKSQDQEVYTERIYNQSSVLLDPSHEQADGSDAEWGFWGTDMLQSEFKAEHPDADASKCEKDDEWRTFAEQAPNWFEGEGEKRALRVMNYVYAKRTPKEIYHLSNGSAAYDEDLMDAPDGPRVLKADPAVTVMLGEDGDELCHTEVVREIKWAKINGCEVLEETDWPGQWLPIIKTVGEELQPYDAERRSEGVVRPMMDSCKGNNYIISKFVERVGLTPIAPIMMAAGQDEGFEDEYNAINTRTLSRIHYNLKDSNGQLVNQPPFRPEARAEIADIAAGVQIFGQAIQATSVVPETALGNTDPTVKSGKLARALIEQAERGTSNFLDNLVRSMRHEARVINDLLYPIYGRPGRMARMVNGQGEMSAVIIGQPFTMQGEGKLQRPVPVQAQEGQAAPEGAKLYKLTPNAGFNVAVKISKSIETRRQQIAEFLGTLISSSPEQMQIIGDKFFKYLDLPDHEDIEKRYEVMLAPPVQKLLQGKQGPSVQQLQAQMEQGAKVMDLMAQQIDGLKKAQEVDQIRADNDFKKTQLSESEETKRTEIKSRADYDIKRLSVVGDLLKTQATLDAKKAEKMIDVAIGQVDAEVEAAGQQADRESAAMEGDAQRQHESSEAEASRQHERANAADERAFTASESAQDREIAQQQAQQTED